MQILTQIIVLLSWLAVPAALVCIVDDWFLRPRRQIAAGRQDAPTPLLAALCYRVLPLLIAASVVRLLFADRLDFSLVLVIVTAVTGAVWWIDVALFRRRRQQAARAAGRDPAVVSEPGTVDYARSFFPVALAVLVLRSFIFEPFRIPSDSMMPTLLDGDFIIVNKFVYGLRLPVINRKFLSIGEPQRGDVVVFRYPVDPGVNYIKRLVGLPGDRVQVVNDRLIINGEPVPFEVVGTFSDGCYMNMHVAEEQLGEHRYSVMFCPVPLETTPLTPPGCNRKGVQGYYCADSSLIGVSSTAASSRVYHVPEGHYLMIGDNRDNSDDGRYWGFVPESHLVGKATRIWFNWDLQRSGGPNWSRIGNRIE